MRAYDRLLGLKQELSDKLSERFVDVSDATSITELVKKIDSMPKYIEKGSGIAPTNPSDNPRVSYPPLKDDIREMHSAYGVEYDPVENKFINGVIDIEKQSWPNVSYNIADSKVKIPGSRLQVDVECSNQFNMSIHYKDYPGAESQTAWLSDIAGHYTKADLKGPKISGTYNFGNYLIYRHTYTDSVHEAGEGHINPPIVEHKYDLLKKATNKSTNYLFYTDSNDSWSSQRSFGAWNGTPLMDSAEIDLTLTPYLYVSFNQPSDSAFTFAMYTDAVWFIGRNGQSYDPSSFMTTETSNFNLATKGHLGSQTICIDMRTFTSSSTLQVKELKLFGAVAGNASGFGQTDCTINYMFFGSYPTGSYEDAWGVPANPTPDGPLIKDAPAVGGEVTIEKIDYYVVGKGSDRDWVKVNDVTFAYEPV